MSFPPTSTLNSSPNNTTNLFRIKVQLGSKKIILPLTHLLQNQYNNNNQLNNQENQQPFLTIRDLSHYLSQRLKVSEIIAISTVDGFMFDYNDLIVDSIANNDCIIAFDHCTYLLHHLPLCSRIHCILLRDDWADSIGKWTECGLTSDERLYIKLGTAKQLQQLEFFHVTELTNLEKPGKRLIGRIGTKPEGQRSETFVQQQNGSNGFISPKNNFNSDCDNWFASAKLMISPSGDVTHIELSVKSNSDPRPQIKRIPITLRNNSIELGTVETLQSSFSRHHLSVPPLPQYISTGPSYHDIYEFKEEESRRREREIDRETARRNIILPSPALNLQIKQLGTIEMEQTPQQNGHFFNTFILNVELLNKSPTPLILTELHTEYLTTSGSWISVDKTYWGRKEKEHVYIWEEEGDMKLEAKEPVSNETVLTRKQVWNF